METINSNAGHDVNRQQVHPGVQPRGGAHEDDWRAFKLWCEATRRAQAPPMSTCVVHALVWISLHVAMWRMGRTYPLVAGAAFSFTLVQVQYVAHDIVHGQWLLGRRMKWTLTHIAMPLFAGVYMKYIWRVSVVLVVLYGDMLSVY